MITLEDFFTKDNGNCHLYSKFLVLNVTPKQLVDALNQINPCWEIYGGRIEGNHVFFCIDKVIPDYIYNITEVLHTTGYADAGWDDIIMTCAARDGEDFKDYKIIWAEASEEGPSRDDDDDTIEDEDATTWIAFIDIIDNQTGIVFHSGGSGLSYERMQYYKNMVDTQTI